jgi:hypothetical protein
LDKEKERKGEGRREKGEGRREKGEGRREERRREKLNYL